MVTILIGIPMHRVDGTGGSTSEKVVDLSQRRMSEGDHAAVPTDTRKNGRSLCDNLINLGYLYQWNVDVYTGCDKRMSV